MPRKLNTRVYVDGNWYGPNDRMPVEVAEMITNPKVWVSESPAPTAIPAEGGGKGKVEEPPRGGPGSSASAWRTFMESQGFEVPDGASAKDMQSSWDERK